MKSGMINLRGGGDGVSPSFGLSRLGEEREVVNQLVITFQQTCTTLFFCCSIEPCCCVVITDMYVVRSGCSKVSVHFSLACKKLSSGPSLDLGIGLLGLVADSERNILR